MTWKVFVVLGALMVWVAGLVVVWWQFSEELGVLADRIGRWWRCRRDRGRRLDGRGRDDPLALWPSSHTPREMDRLTR